MEAASGNSELASNRARGSCAPLKLLTFCLSTSEAELHGHQHKVGGGSQELPTEQSAIPRSFQPVCRALEGREAVPLVILLLLRLGRRRRRRGPGLSRLHTGADQRVRS